MKKDLSNLDRDIMQPISRDIDDAFSDGIDCDVKIMGGNALKLYGSNDTDYNSLYTDVSGNLVIPAESATTYNDDVALSFGTDSDVALNWISATPCFYLSNILDGTQLRIGNGTLDFDITWYASNTGSNTVVFNEGNSDVTFDGVDLSLENSDHLYLGDANNIDISFDATALQVLPAADDTKIYFGNGTLNFDIWVYGNTVADNIIFNASDNIVNLDGVDLQLEAGDILSFGDTAAPGDVYMRWDGSDFDILAAANDTIIKFGDGTESFDIWIYGASANDNIIFNASDNIVNLDGVDLQLEDSDHLYLGASKDVDMTWDGEFDIVPLTDASDMILGDTDHGWDITWYANTSSYSVVFSSTGNTVTFDAVDLVLGDNDILTFGNATAPGDVYMRWDDTDFSVLCAADNTDLIFGTGALSFDITWYGSSTGSLVVFSSTGDDVTFTGVDLSLEDDDHLYLGDSSDVDMYFNGANDFYILPGTDLDNIYFGSTAGDKSWDIIWTGAGAANTVNFGAAGNVITLAAVDVTMSTDDQINFRDTSTYISSHEAGGINLVCTGEIYLNGEVTYPTPATQSNSTGENMTLTAASNRTQFLDSTGAFSLIVPTSSGAGVAGIEFNLFNSTGGAVSVCEGSTSSVIVAIGAGESAIVASNATEWRYIVGTT